MLASFESKTWRDFSQRYHNTFGWYHTDSGGKILVKVTLVDESIVKFTDKRGITFSAIPDKGNVFEFIPLERAVHNLDDGDVVLSERVPARQWKRGVCRENTSLYSLVSSKRMDFNFDLVEQLYSARPHLSYVDEFMDGKRTSVAINPVFSFVNDSVYVYDRRVGTVKPKTSQIVMEDSTYLQEVRDLMRDSFLNFTVTEK